MADKKYCGNVPTGTLTGISGELDVIDKYSSLMKATMDDDSLYERTKDTFFELFKDLELDADKKAEMVADSIAKLSIQLSATSMQTALSWAKEERDGIYSMSILSHQAKKIEAEVLLALAQICNMENDTELKCAQKQVAISGSLRENGPVASWKNGDIETCIPLTLEDKGLKYEQTKMVTAQTYGLLSDTYMKNGVVTINSATGLPESQDGVGKVSEEIRFSERQRVSFEDSKRNHAANAASQMISGLIATETVIGNHQDLVDKWTEAMSYLNSDSECKPDCTII